LATMFYHEHGLHPNGPDPTRWVERTIDRCDSDDCLSGGPAPRPGSGAWNRNDDA
jgi:hypothetical protein